MTRLKRARWLGKFLGAAIVLLGAAAGCTKVSYLPELLTLKEFADTQQSTDVFVEQSREKFKNLVKAVQDDTIKNFSDKTAVLRAFGEPILLKDIQQENATESWLYRDPVVYLNTDQVYLLFDAQGKLLEGHYQQN